MGDEVAILRGLWDGLPSCLTTGTSLAKMAFSVNCQTGDICHILAQPPRESP